MIDKTKIKAIIFDWGGVCCQEAEPFASKELQSRLKLGPELIAKEVEDLYFDYYKGKIKKEDFWQSIIKHFNLVEDEKINIESLSQAYLNSYFIYNDILELIAKLKEKYKIALLSNLTPEMREEIKFKHNLADFFYCQTYSCDQDVSEIKPSSKPFLAVLDKLGEKAENCLFIDNSIKNVLAAEKLGLQTMLFTDKETFLKEISFLS